MDGSCLSLINARLDESYQLLATIARNSDVVAVVVLLQASSETGAGRWNEFECPHRTAEYHSPPTSLSGAGPASRLTQTHGASAACFGQRPARFTHRLMTEDRRDGQQKRDLGIRLRCSHMETVARQGTAKVYKI